MKYLPSIISQMGRRIEGRREAARRRSQPYLLLTFAKLVNLHPYSFLLCRHCFKCPDIGIKTSRF